MFERFRIFRHETTELKLADIPDFLADKFKHEKNEAESRLSSSVQEIRKNFIALKDIAIQMKSKSSPNRYANMLKDKFCDKAIHVINDLPSPSNHYEDMRRFTDMAHKATNAIGDMGIKEFKHLHAFQEDMTKVAEKIRFLETGINYSNKLVNNSEFEKSENAKNDVLSVLETKKRLDEIETEISGLEKSLQPVNNIIADEKRKIEEANSQLARYASERLQIRDFEKSLENIKQQVDNEFSGMDRIMKKFVYFGELTKEETHMLKEYIKDPGIAFLLHDGNNVLRPVLDAMHDYKDRQMIDLDSRKLEKLKDLIRQFDFLVELRKHYHDTNRKKEECEDRLDKKTEPIKQGIRISMQEISSKEKELSAIESKINSGRTEKKQVERRMLDVRNKLELNLSELLGSQIRIA